MNFVIALKMPPKVAISRISTKMTSMQIDALRISIRSMVSLPLARLYEQSTWSLDAPDNYNSGLATENARLPPFVSFGMRVSTF